MWRQRADTNIYKEITKIQQYQSITKDFLQYHIDKLITDKNKINRDKNSYKVSIEPIDEKAKVFQFPQMIFHKHQ